MLRFTSLPLTLIFVAAMVLIPYFHVVILLLDSRRQLYSRARYSTYEASRPARYDTRTGR